MSILSLLCAHNVGELKALWHRTDFDKAGISFGDGTTPAMASGTVIYHGMAFHYEIATVSQVAADHFIFCRSETSVFHSAVQLRLGNAVASGRGVPAVVLALLQLGAVLGRDLHAATVHWHPASIISGYDYFSETVAQYAAGAAFPAMTCVGFDVTQRDVVRTHGLKWLSGQELVFEHPGLPRHEAMRYVVRLVHDIATQGAIHAPLEVRGLKANEIVQLNPDSERHMLLAQLQ